MCRFALSYPGRLPFRLHTGLAPERRVAVRRRSRIMQKGLLTAMTAPQIFWHGTLQESFDLTVAVKRHCTCQFGLMGVRLTTCPPHLMLRDDQRALDGLLFVRRMAERLRREEFSPLEVPASS
jgi:hypothetical protein